MTDMTKVKNQVGHSIQEWSRLYRKPVSPEEHRQLAENLTGFFETLQSWFDIEKKQNKNVRENEPNPHNS